jgi:hypothetical protein
MEKIKVYHGSKKIIKKFSYEYAAIGNTTYGPGFYFTDNLDLAKNYGDFITEAYIFIESPLCTRKEEKIATADLIEIINNAPDILNKSHNYMYNNATSSDAIMQNMINTYKHSNDLLYKTLQLIINDLYDNDIKIFGNVIKNVLGYDSILHIGMDMSYTYVIWDVDQIKVLN